MDNEFTLPRYLYAALVFAMAISVAAIWWQRVALKLQRQATQEHENKFDESLTLARRSIKLQEDANALLREIVEKTK